jgi:hypothetical protein
VVHVRRPDLEPELIPLFSIAIDATRGDGAIIARLA